MAIIVVLVIIYGPDNGNFESLSALTFVALIFSMFNITGSIVIVLRRISRLSNMASDLPLYESELYLRISELLMRADVFDTELLDFIERTFRSKEVIPQ